MILELTTDRGRKASIEGPAETGWWHWTAQGHFKMECGSSLTKRGAMQCARNALASYIHIGDAGTGKWKEPK